MGKLGTDRLGQKTEGIGTSSQGQMLMSSATSALTWTSSLAYTAIKFVSTKHAWIFTAWTLLLLISLVSHNVHLSIGAHPLLHKLSGFLKDGSRISCKIPFSVLSSTARRALQIPKLDSSNAKRVFRILRARAANPPLERLPAAATQVSGRSVDLLRWYGNLCFIQTR